MSDRTACLHCDLLVRIVDLGEGERATCPRCGHVLASRTPGAGSRALALSVAGLVLLLLANAFPFLALESSGLGNVMTLPETAVALHRGGLTALAGLVLAAIVVFPGLMLATILAVVWPVVSGRKAAWLVPAGRLLFGLGPWSMAEVFIIGVIVSLVKIGHMAHVELGVSFWSYVGFALCFTGAVSSLDRMEIWQGIERCAR